MARPFTIRTTFTNDVTRLSRLKGAIEADRNRSQAFKEKACEHLTELIMLLTRGEARIKEPRYLGQPK